MAYKPKYSSKEKQIRTAEPLRDTSSVRPEPPRRASPSPARDPRPTPEEPRQSQPSRQSTVQRITSVILGLLLIPASLYLSFLLLRFMVGSVGNPKPVATPRAGNLQLSQAVSSYVSDRAREVQALPEETVEETTVPTEPPKPVKVKTAYSLPPDTQVAPEPDQSLFGKTADPLALETLLEEADWFIDGQKLYFNPRGERYGEKLVNYYFDDSILALTWQEVFSGSVYTISEVLVSDASQFRRHLAGGVYGSDTQYLTTEMAASVNAVVASAGDFYRFRDFGAVVYEGKARRVEGTYAETCYVDQRGDLHFTYAGEVLTTKAVQEYVDANDIVFSLAFGPVLVDNGALKEHTWYGVGEITEGYARSALCQMGPLHYIVMTANTTGQYQDIPTVATFQQFVARTGCINAYCLDGGQTATIVMNDQLMNRPVYGEQRKISDIIYFATALPGEE